MHKCALQLNGLSMKAIWVSTSCSQLVADGLSNKIERIKDVIFENVERSNCGNLFAGSQKNLSASQNQHFLD